MKRPLKRGIMLKSRKLLTPARDMKVVNNLHIYFILFRNLLAGSCGKWYY